MYEFRLVFMVILAIGAVHGVDRADLYPHGRGVPDKILPPKDDVSSPELVLKTPIVFYDDIYHSIFINSNGLLSFITELSAFFNIQFPLDYPVIAPLYTNVDVRASGSVYYRESQEPDILERATSTIRKAFSYAQDFEAKSALIVTWENVGYHNQGADKVNTFQAIVSTNEMDSYVEFLYPEDGIQWVKGTGSSSSLPDALAQAGFVSADGRMVTLKGSGTDQISHLNQWSNVGNAGQWLFHIGKVGPDGNASPPDVSLEEEEDVPRDCVGGVFYCHSRAMCDDYSTGFCCACQPGFYGNGISCLDEDVPVRVNGKVTGVVNGVNVSDVVLQAYVVPKDGRSYTALSKVPMNVGYDMQSLNVLGTTIGWLFAKPVKGATNGYHLTGGVFNQTITVTYPQTGHQLIIRQKFMGLDVFEQLTMTAEIKGDIPNIPIGSKITIQDYDEQYTSIGPGQLLGHSSQVFQLEGVQIDNTFTVEQNIQYNECSHSGTPVHPFRLKVARNFIGYESENIIRYAMNNKVTPVGVDEDPCKEGRSQCGRHSTCLAEGDSFRCVCNPGYHYEMGNDTGRTCVDADECATGTHNCDANAVCLNNQGSFYCQCNPGFSGDGVTCHREMSCDDVRCDPNAHCIQRSRGMPQCVCMQGYEGNGTYCTSVDDVPNYTFTYPASDTEYRPSYPYDFAQETFTERPPDMGTEEMGPDYRTEYRPDAGSEGGHEHRPDGNQDYNLNGDHSYRPDGSHGYMPNGSHGYMPDGSHGYMPDGSHGYMPNGSHGYMPDGSHGYRPESGADHRPDGSQDHRPEDGHGYRPGEDHAHRPDGSHDYRPEDSHGYRPDSGQTYRPDGSHDYRPDGSHDYRPDPSQGYRPDGSHDYRPDGSHDYRPDGSHDYRPDPSQGYRPDGSHDYRPDGSHDYRPDPSQGYRPDGSHDYRPDGNHDYRPGGSHDYRPDGSHDYRPDGSHDYRPDDRQDYRPDGRPEDSHGYRPGDGHGHRPEDSHGYRPDGSHGYMPDGSQDYRPEDSHGYRPDGSHGYRPDGSHDYRPDGSHDYRPDGSHDYRPQGGHGYRPDGSQDYRPDDGHGYRPDGGQTYRPEGGSDYRPNAGHDYRPDDSHGYRPDGSYGYRPDGSPDYHPESRPEYRPDGSHDYRPDGSHDYRPQDGHGYRPDGSYDYRPDGSHHYRPDGGQSYRPDESHGYRPDGSHDYRPDGSHDYRPNAGHDYRPDGSQMHRPEHSPDYRPGGGHPYGPGGYRPDYRPGGSHDYRPEHSPDYYRPGGPDYGPDYRPDGGHGYRPDHRPEYRPDGRREHDQYGPYGTDEISCDVLNRCHPHAQCLPTSPNGNYRCECNPGYQGDGIECSPSNGQHPFERDECSQPLDCVGDADCVYDPQVRRYTCVCFRGFYKDPVSRICVEDRGAEDHGNCFEVNNCHPDAACLVREGSGRPECVCRPGYEGDGRHECRKTQASCHVFFNCAEGMADCLYDNSIGDYRCRCRQGFDGDGLTCTPIVTCAENASLCGEHASCLPSPLGGYSCRCDPGFVGNGQRCKPEPEKIGNFLLLNQGNTMMKVPYNPTNQDPAKPIMMQYLQQSIGIDIDCTENRVYWSDIAGNKIESASYMGTDVEKFITDEIQSVEGLAIDWISRNIYWTDSKKDTIEVASLDNGMLRKVLVSEGLVNPRGIAVHPSRGKVFWSDWNREAPKIEWANLDGSHRAVFVEGPSVQLPNSLAIDFATDEVCWADAGTKAIECTGIVNRYSRTVTKNCSYPFGLAISQDYYYWTDWTTRKIERIARHSQYLDKPLSVPIVGSAKLYGIVAVPDSCPRISNICQHDYGRCPENHLCLPDGGGGRTCVCGLKEC